MNRMYHSIRALEIRDGVEYPRRTDLCALVWNVLVFERRKLLQTSMRNTTSHRLLPVLRRECMKQAVIVMSIALTACSSTLPATLKIEGNQILRGSASGKVGRDAVLSVENLEGLSCSGELFVRVTETTTEGTIQCSDRRTGKFTANGKGDSWTGEGKLNDGSKFFVLVGTKIWPEH